MQTFLPFPNYQKTASVLDWKRLGNQRNEAKVITRILVLGENLRWKNHPAVRMWKGYEGNLLLYSLEICLEWRMRGYNDSLLPWFLNLATNSPFKENKQFLLKNPNWLGDEKIHSSHRASLKFKKPNWYNQFNWQEEAKIEYYWPV